MWNMSKFLAAPIFALSTIAYCSGEESHKPAPPVQTTSAPTLRPFTGKIIRNKVRIRLQPSVDGNIFRQMEQGDLVIVLEESEDFYAIKPPVGTKGYVFRTFVLDNVVEGSRVNVRLQPAIEAPILAQLNSGDRVKGSISKANNKWLEIDAPESTRFYIAKEFVEKIGDPDLMAILEKRKEEVNHLLNSTLEIAQKELEKPFEEIKIDPIYANFTKITTDYTEFPNQVKLAKEHLSTTQSNYLKKKVAFLESNKSIAQQTHQKETIETVQPIDVATAPITSPTSVQEPVVIAIEKPLIQEYVERPSPWIAIEERLFSDWKKGNPDQTQEEFYQIARHDGIPLKGIIEPYQRSIKNKPGDYVLVHYDDRRPIAYLYSTKINLQDKVGHEVAITAAPRPNNHFAFPAYFVLSVD